MDFPENHVAKFHAEFPDFMRIFTDLLTVGVWSQDWGGVREVLGGVKSELMLILCMFNA